MSATDMVNLDNASQVLVVGLGDLGTAIATGLTASGLGVLGIDNNPAVLSSTPRSVAAVMVDATDPDDLRHNGALDVDLAIITLGDSFGASVLVAGYLMDAGVPRIWVAAASESRGRILRRLGVERVLFPAQDAAADYSGDVLAARPPMMRIHAGRALATIPVPRSMTGTRWANYLLQEWHEVDPLAIVTADGVVRAWTGEPVLSAGEHIVVAGDDELLLRLNLKVTKGEHR